MIRPQIEILIRIKNDLLTNTETIKTNYLTRQQYLNNFLIRNEDLQGIDKDLYYPYIGELFNEYIY